MAISGIPPSVPRDIAERLSAFRADVVRALSVHVGDVVLFGSRARGDGHAGADYDVAAGVLRDGVAIP